MRKSMPRKAKAKTPVTRGWVVKKCFTKLEKVEGNSTPAPKQFTKTVSKLFGNHAAAVTFCEIAKKFPQVGPGEHDVSYYVTEDAGHDTLPAAF
jgi:hypothetical protein